MLGEHRHETQDQWELMVVASGKVETYCALADDSRFGVEHDDEIPRRLGVEV